MIIYTDGACFPNPGSGAWAYVVVENDEIINMHSGYEPNTTSNRMEYSALIKAIESYGETIQTIHTDSKLLVNTCMTWRFGWKNKGWTKKKNSTKPKHVIMNLDLVKRIDELLTIHDQIEVLWVKGHNGNIFNEAADELANKTAYQIKSTPRVPLKEKKPEQLPNKCNWERGIQRAKRDLEKSARLKGFR